MRTKEIIGGRHTHGGYIELSRTTVAYRDVPIYSSVVVEGRKNQKRKKEEVVYRSRKILQLLGPLYVSRIWALHIAWKKAERALTQSEVDNL